jgi:Tfp pilus assembly protein PilF
MGRHYQRGIVLFRQKRYGQAVDEFRQELAENIDDPWSHAMRALCLVECNRHRDAVEEAKLGVKSAPDDGYCLYALAFVCYRRVLHQHAPDDIPRFLNQPKQTIRDAIQRDPKNTAYFELLGRILDMQGQLDEAVKAARNGLAIDPRDEGCSNLLADLLLDLGRKQEAALTLQSALQNNPENARTHCNRGWTYLHQRLPDKASEHFQQALRIDPLLKSARTGLVAALKGRNLFCRPFLIYNLRIGRLGAKPVSWFCTLMIGGMALMILTDFPKLLGRVSWVGLCILLSLTVVPALVDDISTLVLLRDEMGRKLLSRGDLTGSLFALLGALILFGTATALLWIGIPVEKGLIGGAILGVSAAAVLRTHSRYTTRA